MTVGNAAFERSTIQAPWNFGRFDTSAAHTSISSSKWVKPWRTKPGRFFHAARNGACASASLSEGNFAPHGPSGG